ncbi:MAG TPA: HlyD family efflux transporter periplasmic adaptor subunit [Thermoanaerobaculia bacterium]|jgi:HlyD family secretion protein|nr:HlyD family efflux transporter periplasmic adaptor subunit [Thermoanaerobaculia bacterium]
MDRKIAQSVRTKRIARRVIVSVVALAALIFCVAATVSWLRPSVRRSDLQIARVERGTVDATIQASGTVVPEVETVISSPVEARALRIQHRAGDRLHAGDAILTLDTSATKLDLDKLNDAVAQKESALAQARLKAEEQIAAAGAALEQKQLDSDILKLKASQNTRMHAEGLVSAQDELVAVTAKKKSDIEIAQLRDAMGRTKRTADAQIAAAQLDLRTAQKERDQSERQLNLAMTRSDQDGVLTWVLPEVGATVRKGDVIARVADLSAYRVVATISDVHASKLAAGMRAHVKLDDTTTIDGTISGIDPRIENGIARFYVTLDQRAHPRLRNNLRVDVLPVLSSHGNVLRVRRGALGQGEREEVFVVRGNVLVRTLVRWGLAGDELIQPIDGLREGDQVVISNMSEYQGLKELRLK